MKSSLRSRWLVLPLLLAACSDDTVAKLDTGRTADRSTVADRSNGGEKSLVDKGGSAVDKSGTAGDTTPAGCAVSFAGCSSYQDATGGSATINFGGGVGLAYSPKCLKVKVGQSVTFSGDFGTHPLTQAPCAPAQVITTPSGTTASFTFNTAGIYGFYCAVHGTPQGTGMAGALMVVP